jgi:hypothetical protein
MLNLLLLLPLMQDLPTFRSDVALVHVDAEVRQQTLPVDGLRPQDFLVFDAGKRQKCAPWSPACLTRRSALKLTEVLPIGLETMPHPADFNRTFTRVHEEQPIIARAKPQFLRVLQALQSPAPDSAKRCSA